MTPAATTQDVLLGYTPAPEGRDPRQTRFIGDVVVELGYAPLTEVEKAIAASRATGRRTGEILLGNGTLTPDQLARVIAERFGVAHLRPRRVQGRHVGGERGQRRRRPPLRGRPRPFVDDRTLLVAMADPGNVLAVDDIALMTGYEVRPASAAREDVLCSDQRASAARRHRRRRGRGGRSRHARAARLGRRRADHQARALAHRPGRRAAARRTSTSSRATASLVVRYRIDGVLSDATTVPRRHGRAASSRASRSWRASTSPSAALPQDGRLTLTLDGRRIDIRVATLPLVGGESVVLRILDKDRGVGGPRRAGHGAPRPATRSARCFKGAHGAMLVTGPTGSGKTTTLYGALRDVSHAREEHHHDRGPGRVPSSRASSRCRSTRRPA